MYLLTKEKNMNVVEGLKNGESLKQVYQAYLSQTIRH